MDPVFIVAGVVAVVVLIIVAKTAVVVPQQSAYVVERLGRRTSYTYQLEAFAAAVRHGAPVVTDADFSVATMAMVDAAYELAGLAPRRPAS